MIITKEDIKFNNDNLQAQFEKDNADLEAYAKECERVNKLPIIISVISTPCFLASVVIAFILFDYLPGVLFYSLLAIAFISGLYILVFLFTTELDSLPSEKIPAVVVVDYRRAIKLQKIINEYEILNINVEKRDKTSYLHIDYIDPEDKETVLSLSHSINELSRKINTTEPIINVEYITEPWRNVNINVILPYER